MTVHYIQPFAVDKDICKSYNQACKLIPDEDWICITDMDTMFLHPEQKRIIDRVANSGQADLYGCVSNRCNVPDLVLPSMFDERDLKKHYQKAEERIQFKDVVDPYKGVIPGYFMLFSKKTWNQVQGFSIPEYGVNYAFDQYFSAKIKSKAIIKGVYLLHLYRIWSNMPAWDIEHLK
jgi:hypothetical protein